MPPRTGHTKSALGSTDMRVDPFHAMHAALAKIIAACVRYVHVCYATAHSDAEMKRNSSALQAAETQLVTAEQGPENANLKLSLQSYDEPRNFLHSPHSCTAQRCGVSFKSPTSSHH